MKTVIVKLHLYPKGVPSASRSNGNFVDNIKKAFYKIYPRMPVTFQKTHEQDFSDELAFTLPCGKRVSGKTEVYNIEMVIKNKFPDYAGLYNRRKEATSLSS